MQNPTPQQAAFIAAMASSRSIILRAVAGSGKTTTLVAGAEALSEASHGPGLAVAFNVSIKEALRNRMPEWIEVMTMNGLGHKALSRSLGKSLKLDQGKLRGILREVLSRDQASTIWAPVSRLVSLAMANGLVPDGGQGQPQALIQGTYSAWEALASTADLDFSEEIYEAADKALRKSIQLTLDKGLISFDDQLYIPTLWRYPFKQFKTIFVDEAQDLSLLQHLMIGRSLRPPPFGRLIAVGDPNQAIYGFRGASSGSMELLQRQYNAEWLPLTYSFRCAKSIIAFAQAIVPDIQPWPQAPQGQVDHWESWTPRSIPLGAAVICRNTAPLIRLCFQLIRAGISARVLGRDIGEGLKSILKGYKGSSAADIQIWVEDWQSRELAAALRKDDEAKADRIRDRAGSLMCILEESLAADIPTATAAIDALFSAGPEASINLMTGHKSKGLEFDTVVFLEPQLVPSKWARKATAENPDAAWMLEQELNLKYVILTRAKRHLIFASFKQQVEEGTPSDANSP